MLSTIYAKKIYVMYKINPYQGIHINVLSKIFTENRNHENMPRTDVIILDDIHIN